MDNLDALLLKSRSIPIKNDFQFETLSSPTEFYETLRKMIATAEDSVILSALYMGSGHLEAQLLKDLHQALSDEKRPNLKIKLIFDHSRAQRGGDRSSLRLLSPLITQFPGRIEVFLYQMPQLREFPFSYLPGQLKEVVAVYHCKFCVADSRVILTGANFGEEYFSTRQDRYWLVDQRESESARGIVEFLREFVEVMSEDCFRLSGDGSLHRTSDVTAFSMREKLLALISRSHGGDSDSEASGVTCFPLIQHKSLRVTSEEDTILSLMRRMSALLLQSRTSSAASSSEDVMQVKFSTPYTNFSSQLSEKILDVCYLGHSVSILGPNATSHGFASAKGLKSLIPLLHVEAFTTAMKAAYDKICTKIPEENDVTSASTNTRDKPEHHHYFYEQLEHYTFQRSGWTFHAKGFWFDVSSKVASSTPYNSDKKADVSSLSGSYIGSSNFGERSWSRDLELGFLFLQRPHQTSDVSAGRDFKAFLTRDYDLLRSQCEKDLTLNQRIASFSHHPPSHSSKFFNQTHSYDSQGPQNNLLSLNNLKASLHQRMIGLLARLVKSYL